MATIEDRALTLDALGRILEAMSEGKVSDLLSLQRHPIQVVVTAATTWDTMPPADLAALKEIFPEGTMKPSTRATHPRNARHRTKATVQDSYHYVALLREPDTTRSQWRPDHPPRVEVWGIFLPHECTRFVGYLDPSDKPRWRCADHGCQKVMAIREARSKGLIP